MTHHLFVYGTLKRRSRHPMARKLENAARHVGTGRIHGRLYDLGQFPGLKESCLPEETVHGDLYDLGSDAEPLLRELDAYENAESPPPRPFERTVTSVSHDDGSTIAAWVYWYRGDVCEAHRIASGSFEYNCEYPQAPSTGSA